jgi:hypothetical protein
MQSYDSYARDRLIAQFDESIMKLFRMNNSWVRAQRYRESGNLIQWRWVLDSLYLELAYESERLDKDNELEGKPEGYVAKLKKLDHNIPELILKRKLADLYETLKEKERLLREIQQESGMGTKHKSMIDDEMD